MLCVTSRLANANPNLDSSEAFLLLFYK